MKRQHYHVSVVIPTWNGEKLLRKNLPLVLAALPIGTEVIVVDDGSTDGSQKYLKAQVNQARKLKLTFRVLFNHHNRGFIYSCDRGVREATGDLVILLNNDVVPQKGFLSPVLRHFSDSKVFAVTLNEKTWGWARLFWQGGFIQLGDGGQSNEAHVSAWASGGSAVFRKTIWQKLGGFDPVYEPFYWEDVDLGYRAWKSGYKIYWEPKAVVDHRHESTTSKFSHRYVQSIQERNRLLFIWRNINDKALRRQHWWGIMRRSLHHPGYAKIVVMALSRLLSYHHPPKRTDVRNDREIFALFNEK